MSKKQLRSRLDSLFSDFDEIVEPTTSTKIETPLGWWWECDADRRYISCGKEVYDCLGIHSSRFRDQLFTHYAIAEQSVERLTSVFDRNIFPVELDVYFQSPEGVFVPARISIHHRPKLNGEKPGWRGYAQVISDPDTLGYSAEYLHFPDDSLGERLNLSIKNVDIPKASKKASKINQNKYPESTTSPISNIQNVNDQESVLLTPIDLHTEGKGYIKIVGDRQRNWSEDEKLLIQEVANQLSIALESAQAYELAQKAYEEIRQADHMKSQFLANMSHELRTPLNSIIGFSKVILKGIDGEINEIQEQDLTSIYNSGQHLLGLINDVLDLSKIEAGKMEMQLDEVNIIELINSVMSTTIGLVKDKPVKLGHILPESLPIVIADTTRIRQVLLNFLSNAAKFTEEGSITVKAIETLGPDGAPEILVTVTDTGDGIAPEDRDKLFQPFSQVDDSPTRKTGGTGLGLSICRSFMEMHKGRIGLLWSEVGKGSTFFFTLPIQNNDQQPFEENQSSQDNGITQ